MEEEEVKKRASEIKEIKIIFSHYHIAKYFQPFYQQDRKEGKKTEIMNLNRWDSSVCRVTRTTQASEHMYAHKCKPVIA